MQLDPRLHLIFSRRSIRKFKSDPVDAATLELLLQAAMAAPSAMNSRPWRFVVVTNRERLARLQEGLPFGRHDPPAAILVCGSPADARNPAGLMFWIQDCSAAIQNLLLGANALGLGSVWVGIYPVKTFIRHLRRTLDLPVALIPLGLVYVGHPLETKPARTQYDPGRVRWLE